MQQASGRGELTPNFGSLKPALEKAACEIPEHQSLFNLGAETEAPNRKARPTKEWIKLA